MITRGQIRDIMNDVDKTLNKVNMDRVPGGKAELHGYSCVKLS